MVRFTSEALEELSDSTRARSIRILHLSVRGANLLEKASLVTVGRLVDKAREGLPKIRGAGMTTVGEIVQALNALSDSICRNGDVDWVEYAEHRSFRVLPEHASDLGTHEPVRLLAQLSSAAAESYAGPLGRRIFQTLFLETGSDAALFRNLADSAGYTRQGIAFLRDEVLAMLRATIFHDDYTSCSFRFRDWLCIPLRRLKDRVLMTADRILSASEWNGMLLETLSITPENVGRVQKFIFALLDYQVLNSRGKQYQPIVLSQDRDSKALGHVLAQIELLLKIEYPLGLSERQLAKKLQLCGKRGPSIEELPILVAAVPGIEYRQREKRYRAIVASLRRVPDQLERILRERGVPMHLSEISEELAKSQRRIGTRGKQIHIGHAMSSDERFKSIGRSGTWALRRWDVDTGTIADVAAKLLQKSCRPMNETELYSLIIARRPVRIRSIHSLLREDGRFRRVKPRTWELI